LALSALACVALQPGVRPSVAQQPAAAAPNLPLDPAVRLDSLPNGLRSYVRVNREPRNRAELRLVVNAGSVLEDEDQRGLAHVVEHLAFNGTTRFPKQSLVDFLERIGMRFGAHVNAYTSFDETVFFLQVPTDSAGVVAQGLDILQDWATALSFDSDEVERERGVVIEEWRLGLGAEDRLFKKQLPVLLQGSPYAERLPIGAVETLRGFPRDRLVRYYRDWYRPDLMAVIAVGDFDADSVVAMIRRRFQSIPRPPSPIPRRTIPVPVLDSTRVVVATDPELPYSTVSVTFRGPRRVQRTEVDFRRGLIERLVAAMMNARLSELTRRPNPPFAAAVVARQAWVRPVEFVLLGAATGEGVLGRGLEALVTEAERVRRHGFTATELGRARDDLLRGYERGFAEREQTPSSSLADEYQRNFLEQEPIPGIETEYRLARGFLEGITLEEATEAGRAWFVSADRVLLASAPEKAGLEPPDAAALLATLDHAAGLEVEPYQDEVGDEPLVPNPPAPGSVLSETRDPRLGTVRWTLGNGVQVILKPTDFKADEVLFTAYSPGGTSLAPDSLYLSAWLATDLVELGGLGAFDQVALQKKLAGRVASLGTQITTTQEGLAGSASPKDLETLLQLIYLTMTAPRADTAAFQAFLANARAALANRGADPEAAYGDTVQVTLAQHHPRARPFSLAVLDSLDLDVAYRFFRERYADASDFTFVFVGALHPDSLREPVARWLGGLPAVRRGDRWRDPGIRPPAGVVERIVRQGLEPKSLTRIAFTGPFESTRASRAPLQALARTLEIRLRETVREALGATYDVNVSASTAREPVASYTFNVSFGSAPERADELVRVIFAVLDSVRALGPRDGDLVKVREAEVRARETALRRNGYWVSQLAFLDQTGEDPAAVLDPRGDADLMTADALREAARRYLRPDRYVRVTLLPEPGRGRP
jgi:zinc protease